MMVTEKRVTYVPHEDYYVLLGIPDTATQAEVKVAYRKQIVRIHPDKPSGDTTTAATLNVAWETLGDERKRAAYDVLRRRYLGSVAAAAKEKEKAASDKATRPKARARAATSVAPKVKSTATKRKAASPPPPSAVEIAVENLVRSIQNAEYGKAFGWFVLGALASNAKRPRPKRRQGGRRSRR
jgi:curved DNA-binding protein CbpA